MKIYLSARQARRAELLAHKPELVAKGHDVEGDFEEEEIPDTDESTSAAQPREPGEAGGGNEPGHGSEMSFRDFADARGLMSRTEMYLAKAAERRFAKIIGCDLFVAYTDGENHTREAAYAEYGMALTHIRNGKKVWIVGKRYHLLHWYKDVPAFPTHAEFMKALDALVAAEGGAKTEKEQA